MNMQKEIRPLFRPLAVVLLVFGTSCLAASEVDSLDLGGGCQAAQEKGAAYARRMGNDSSASVCQAGKNQRLLGELQVRIARLCQEIPTWTQLRDQGEGMIREADQTIRQSCT